MSSLVLLYVNQRFFYSDCKDCQTSLNKYVGIVYNLIPYHCQHEVVYEMFQILTICISNIGKWIKSTTKYTVTEAFLAFSKTDKDEVVKFYICAKIKLLLY